MKELYESTAEDLLFGIGVLQMPGCRPAPYIHVHYRDWPREKLDVVRESFQSGIILVSARRKSGVHDVYIATRERAAVQCRENGKTSVLRCPAWNAHLESVEHKVFAFFERSKQAFGGFLLLLQTPEWEFMTGVDEIRDSAAVGVILPREMEMPPIARRNPND